MMLQQTANLGRKSGKVDGKSSKAKAKKGKKAKK